MYNEEETIGSVVTRALRYVDEVICIDDGSSDASARIAEACGATVIRHRVNRGYGGALKTCSCERVSLTPTPSSCWTPTASTKPLTFPNC